MPLIEVRSPISRASVEATDQQLQEHGDLRWSVVEDVLAQTAGVVGVFDSLAEARAAWSQLARELPAHGVPAYRELADADWRESYKAHFKAWRCGRLHWVPEWERATHRLPAGHVAVYLDPGMAFGTGNHETTRLCCERLVAFVRTLPPRGRGSWRVIDAGCGSGILAISAAKLGCRHVFAFDNDPDAVAITGENARRNRVASRIQVRTAGLMEGLARRRADLVLANIQADVLCAHLDVLLGAVAPRGFLVMSGILARELATVRSTFAARAGTAWSAHTRMLGEWADLTLRRRDP